MQVTPRTVLRGFLLIGGLALATLGVADWSVQYMGIGGIAAVLGAFGLWWEYRTTATED